MRLLVFLPPDVKETGPVALPPRRLDPSGRLAQYGGCGGPVCTLSWKEKGGEHGTGGGSARGLPGGNRGCNRRETDLGSCTAAQVAEAVIRCVERNKARIFINSVPVKPLIILGLVFPRFVDVFCRWTGVTRQNKQKVYKRMEADRRKQR